jgi:hypothetical protein
MPSVQAGDYSTIWSSISPLILIWLGFFLVYFIVQFFIQAYWIYYAFDDVGIFGSIKKSVSLVVGNLKAFIIFFIISIALSLTGVAASYITCCFAGFVMPLVLLLVNLLNMVTLMKMKLQSEGNDKTAGFKAPQAPASVAQQPSAQIAQSQPQSSQIQAPAPVQMSMKNIVPSAIAASKPAAPKLPAASAKKPSAARKKPAPKAKKKAN